MTSERSVPPSRKSSRKRKVYWVLFYCFIALLLIAVAFVGGAYIYFSKDLPRLTSVKDYSPNVVTRVFSEHGEVIAEFFVEKRYAIPIEDMPTELRQYSIDLIGGKCGECLTRFNRSSSTIASNLPLTKIQAALFQEMGCVIPSMIILNLF